MILLFPLDLLFSFLCIIIILITNLDVTKNEDKKEVTLWSVVYDLTKRCLYYRSRAILSARFICLKDIPFDAASSIELENDYGSDEQDMSSNLKVFSHVEEL